MKKTVQKRNSKQETKEAILSTALELIVEKGVNRLSLREIARRIGYSPAGLYEYFDGKDEIIQAVRYEALSRFKRELTSIPPRTAFSEYITNLGLAYIQFAKKYPQQFFLLFTHLRGEIEETPEEIELSRNSYALLSGAVQEAIDNQEIPTEENFRTQEIAYIFWAMVHGMAMLQVIYTRRFNIDFPEVNKLAIEKLVEGLTIKR